MTTPIEEAALLVPPPQVQPTQVVVPEAERLWLQQMTDAAAARAAWHELDELPIPQRTFEDSRGLPAYTILSDGSKCFPTPSRVGEEITWIDDTEVGPDLVSLRRSGFVLWDGSIPQEERGLFDHGKTGIGGDVPREAERDFQEGERSAEGEGIAA